MSPELFEQVVALARQAGEATLAYRPDRETGLPGTLPMNTQSKADDSPVTLADLTANRVIVEGLEQLTRGVPVVSEELPESLVHRQPQGRFWLVDPLDGTREFVRGGDDYTVNIALIENGQSIWGVVYAPAVDQMYWGGHQMGSFRTLEGQRVVMRVSPMQERVRQGVRVVASKSHLTDATKVLIERLNNVDLVQTGSSLKFCLIAQGDADFYPRLGDTAEWDTAAAQAVLEGAGGVACDLRGNRLFYGKPNVLNPHFMAASAHPQTWFPGWPLQ